MLFLNIKNKYQEILFNQFSFKCIRRKNFILRYTYIVQDTDQILKCIHSDTESNVINLVGGFFLFVFFGFFFGFSFFSFFAVIVPAVSACPLPGYTYNRYFGCLRYVVIPSPINAEAASQFCANEGGQLLLLNSDEEVEELRRLIGMSSALG